MLGLGFSPCCELVRDPLNLARDVGKVERIVGLHRREGRRLTPPAVKQLLVGGHSVTVVGFRVLRDLQQAVGKTLGRSPARVANRLGDSLGSSSWVA